MRKARELGRKFKSFKRVYEMWNIRDYRLFYGRKAGEKLIGKCIGRNVIIGSEKLTVY